MTDIRTNDSAVVRTVDESDSYTGALAGVTAEAVRIGRGLGPNVVVAARGEPVTVTSVRYGFPVNAWAQIPNDRMLVAYVHDSREGSQWCGVPLRAGSVIVYPPGTNHFAVAEAGLRLTYAVTEPERLMVLADDLGLASELPPDGKVLEVPRSSAAERLGVAMSQHIGAARGAVPTEGSSEPVLTALAGVLAGDPPPNLHGRGRGIDSRDIVRSCIAYAEAIDRVPSIRELCLTAHVSERRLRSAFNELFDCSPTSYFRRWALERAHRWLRDAEPGERTVTDVASRLGIFHFGRFASYYRRVYGVNPSTTLRAVGS